MNAVNKEYQNKARRLLENWQDEEIFSRNEPAENLLAGMIDHTLLKPDASIAAVNKLCQEAREYKFASVCVNPVHVERCVQNLENEIATCTVIGFPLGSNHTDIKAAEAQLAEKQGARELDMVLNVGLLKTANYQDVFEDIKAVRLAGPEAVLKVILETCLLTEAEIIIASLLCREAGADYVKTSTGFSSGGATVEHVSLMRYVVNDDLGVKAAGGIRTREDALKMVRAGATRLGASAGVSIIGG